MAQRIFSAEHLMNQVNHCQDRRFELALSLRVAQQHNPYNRITHVMKLGLTRVCLTPVIALQSSSATALRKSLPGNKNNYKSQLNIAYAKRSHVLMKLALAVPTGRTTFAAWPCSGARVVQLLRRHYMRAQKHTYCMCDKCVVMSSHRFNTVRRKMPSFFLAIACCPHQQSSARSGCCILRCEFRTLN